MTGNNAITFNRFYIMEFLQATGIRIRKQLPEEQAEVTGALVDNLRGLDDISTGIERLAREQGTGELSIFLFDIFDRVEDYPPSVAYDALQDIVEDFVNALAVMLEEKETIESLKLVNADFSEMETATEPVVEPEALAEEQSVTKKMVLMK